MRIDKSKISDFPIAMTCSACSDPLVPVAVRIDEGFNQPSLARIEFISDTPKIDLDDLMGQKIEFVAKVPDSADRLADGTRERKHVGICTTARFVGTFDGACHYWVEIRPKMWFLSLNQDCRIFQNMKAPDIIKEVLGDYGVTYDEQLSETYRERIICMQYRESDLDFMHRLMEEEGIHYFFTHDGGEEKMVIHDDSAAHDPVPCEDTIRYIDVVDDQRRDWEHFFQWHPQHYATTGKFTHTDYNFEKPKAKLESFRSMEKGKHDLKTREIYDYPGHYSESGDGDRYSRIKMEERAIRYKTWRGAGLVSNVEVGKVFKVKGHPATGEGEKFVASSATHLFQLNEEELTALEVSRFPSGSLRDEMENEPYQVQVTAIPKKEKFRPAPITPWPEIAGCHTAVVTGPEGEEIHTDKYGRIRIQFHWDRLGKSNEKSTCWVRCMMPWTGKNWGMIAIPRIGQEVVVQFEEGDPDRPLVIGMLYNADTMPPYELPANMTQSGIKTRSSKQGSGDNFNELRFEDKKGEEEVYFHAEKDYKQIVENNADIEIGMEKGGKGEADKGDLNQKIWHDKTEEVGNNLSVKIGYGDGGMDPGDMSHEVYNDRTETIGNNFSTTVEKGDQTINVQTGNQTTTIDTGNQETTVSMGNHSLDVSMGQSTTNAMQMIVLECGKSKITLEPAKITIESVMIEIKGDAMTKVSAAMTEVQGTGMLQLKGGLIKIN